MTAAQGERVQAVLAEKARRKLEALRLYEPLPTQLAFHSSQAKMRLVRGSNRAGKTLATCVETARAVTGQDPHGKYPLRDGRCFCVAKDLSQVGEVLWRKMARAGAFKIIRDEVTQEWRSFRPWEEADRARESQAKPAPPLIPPRLIKSVSWTNKKEGIPNKVLLHNGWEMNFFSSLGKPPQGSDIDLFHFDEEIVDKDWLPEMQARTLDRKGRGTWGATPQAGTAALFDLHERAEAEEGKANPAVTEHLVLLVDNPHVGEDEKRQFAASLSEEEFRVRIGGEFAVIGYLVYPEFSMLRHGVAWQPIPADWTRYAIVDPGHQVCAVLFAAVPPVDFGDFVYLFDGLYLRNCDAMMFGQAMAQKTVGQTFEAFLIDMHLGRHTETGSGRTVVEQYTTALKQQRVRCVRTGHGFLPASDDVQGGILAVHDLMRVREDGTTKLRVLAGAVPALEWEVRRYRNLVVDGVITDKPNQRRNNHMMDDLRYLAAFRPRHVKPGERKPHPTGAILAFRAKEKKRRQAEYGEDGREFIHLGPGRKGA